MTNTVGVIFSAQPNQVLDAYRRIQEEAKRTNKEVRSMADIHFPGLEDAKRDLEEINRGFQQMFSKVVRGNQAEALRSGAKGGVYDRDIISWMQNGRRQFPDEAAWQRHVQGVLRQAGNLSAMGSFGGGAPGGGGGGWGSHAMNTLIGGMVGGNFGGAVGGLAGGGLGGFIGGGLGWFIGKNPVTAAAGAEIGSNIGSAFGGAAGSKFQGAVNHYTDMTVQESFGLTDLRRGISAMNQDFEKFRKSIRAAGEGLDVTFNESLAMSRLYAGTAGASGSAATRFGASQGMLLSRAFGMELGQGTGMMGRAGWLGLKNGDAKEQMMMLAQVLEGSHLGGRQAEAAEAMLKFADKSASLIGEGGNIEGYTAKLLALFNSKDQGVKANAGGIMSGIDDVIRHGGGTPGAQNMLRNLLHDNGVTDYADQEAALSEGFSYKFEDGPNKGRMLGMLALQNAARQSRSANWLGVILRDSFNTPMKLGMKAVPDILGSMDILDPKLKSAAEARIADYMKGVGPDSNNDADRLRMAYATKSNEIQKLLGDNTMGIVTKYTEAMGDLTKAINSWLNTGKPSELTDMRDRTMKGIEKSSMQSALSGYSMVNDPMVMDKINTMAREYGVNIGSTKFMSKEMDTLNGRAGVDHLYVSGPIDKTKAFSDAVDLFQKQMHEGFMVHVTVSTDKNGNVTGAKVSPTVPKPSVH